jgi:hypothetical protein
MMKLLIESWEYLLLVVLFGTVIAVADMNWPDHMGGGGHLLRALGL